ncbi:MAG: single-stranded DNA-binding protein [Candidatus Hatepunaea meridiana]|nr:single-stranded DNA-binding protein [Candidatus Hatepunaea meridiana]
MARGVNKVILIGNLGKDPELSYTPNGLAVTRLSLATTEKRKNKEGEWVESTEWHRLKMFGKNAENAGQYLTKGQTIYVEGRIHYDSYEKEGVTRYTTEIIVFLFNMLSRRDEGSSTYSAPPPPPQETSPAPPPPQNLPEEDIEDDLPF